jgi:hypothetical protein
MTKIRRVVLDVLKPHDPALPEFTRDVADLADVSAVDANLVEMDREVQNVKLAVDGRDLDVLAIETEIETLGATVHSIDRIAAGDYIMGENGRPVGAEPGSRSGSVE